MTPKEELTPSETLIMKCIWDSGQEMALGEILAQVNETYGKHWKSQTVSTFLGKLVYKGFVRMKRKGRRITYEILVDEKTYSAQQADQFVAFWNEGSVGQFLTAFYHDKKATKEELEELRKIIDELDN